MLVYLLCRWLTATRLGRLLVALRDDENRERFLGYNPVLLKTLLFAFSAALAGLAGALFIPQVRIISPSAMGVVPSCWSSSSSTSPSPWAITTLYDGDRVHRGQRADEHL